MIMSIEAMKWVNVVCIIINAFGVPFHYYNGTWFGLSISTVGLIVCSYNVLIGIPEMEKCSLRSDKP